MPVRPILLPDLDAELTTALTHIEEVLLSLGGWEDDPAADPVELPSPIAGGVALRAVRRLWDAVAPTQGEYAGRAGLTQTMYSPDGRYEHIPLRLAHLDQDDVDVLAAAAKQLTAPVSDWHVRDALDQMARAFNATGDELSVRAIRLANLLDMRTADPDSQAIVRVLDGEGRAARMVLTEAEEQAYRRVTREMNHRWTDGSPIAVWGY